MARQDGLQPFSRLREKVPEGRMRARAKRAAFAVPRRAPGCPRYAARRETRMFGSTQPLKDLLARLLAQPDEIMLSLGAGGELLVARLRALLSLLILAMPLIAALGGAKSGRSEEHPSELQSLMRTSYAVFCM